MRVIPVKPNMSLIPSYVSKVYEHTISLVKVADYCFTVDNLS